MRKQNKTKVYQGFLVSDDNENACQLCDIIMGDDELLLNLHTPIVL